LNFFIFKVLTRSAEKSANLVFFLLKRAVGFSEFLCQGEFPKKKVLPPVEKALLPVKKALLPVKKALLLCYSGTVSLRGATESTRERGFSIMEERK